MSVSLSFITSKETFNVPLCFDKDDCAGCLDINVFGTNCVLTSIEI